MLFGTSPFVDLAKIELSRNGLAQFRHAIFGRTLGAVPADEVRARAREMAEDLLEFMKS